MLAFDTEMHLIDPTLPTPRVVCGSFHDGERGELLPRDAAIERPAGRYVVRAQPTLPVESPVTVAGGETHALTLSGP